MPRPDVELLTIPFSHYCEKARWSLDRAGVAYVERAYVPGVHVVPMRAAGGKTVPVLRTADEVLTQSSAILEYADRRSGALWLADEALAERGRVLVDDYDRTLGKASRRLAYYHLLPHPTALVASVGASLGRLERGAFRALLPILRPLLRSRYGVHEEGATEARRIIDASFDRAAATLAQHGPYLLGDRMTGADLTFAALASPMLLPPAHPNYDSSLSGLPLTMQRDVTRLRAHPAGRHALRVYAEHRQA